MNAPGSHPVLTLHGYGVSFGARVVLSEIELDLEPQGIDVLMGPVKAGKSTLLRSLAGLNRGNALYRSWGQALVLGEPVDRRPPALVQQHAAVLNATVKDALIFHARQLGSRTPTSWNELAEQILANNGLANLVPRLGDALLDLPLERQRAVNILSQALTEPPLLFVDEPTYGLDENASHWLIDWLSGLGKRYRIVVVLHHQGQARRLADRIILLGGGRVLAHHDVDRFFNRPANEWVEQFVRTGSLSIPSPDARPEELAADVPAPPPLPPAAIEAVAEFVPQTAPNPPAGPPAKRMASLPPVSRDGVEVAALVGTQAPADSRGPTGFHWIVPGRLAGCAEPGVSSPIDYDMDLLVRIGVTNLVTLTERDLDQAALARHGLKNIHLPIFDRESPSIRQTYMLLHRMQALLDNGQTIAVHCKAGIGRTGTILAAWLIREGGLSATSAIERLRNINRYYVQTETQEQFLHDFEADLLLRL